MNVIEFTNVWKKFKVGRKFNSLRDTIPKLFRGPGIKKGELKENEFWALQDVSFNVKKGDVVGIIGPNGAGKSTILKLLFKILAPNKGKISIDGNVSGLIEVTAGFHPELTGRENVYLNGTIIGMRKKEIDKKFDEIVEFSGIGEFIDTPVKRYSSGMFARLGFSVVAHMDPDILLVDEVLAVGDMAFQAKCSQKMRELLNSGATIVLVSHNLTLVQNLCKRVILLEKGSILKTGAPEEIIRDYQDIVYKKSEAELKKQLNVPDYKVQINKDTLVKILDVSFCDGEYKNKESFNIDEPISIQFGYDAKEIIENPTFSLDIIRADGVLCCSSNTKDNGYLIEQINNKGMIKIDLGNINLAPGIYLIKLSIWDKDMIHPYAIRKKDIFRIETAKFGNGATPVFLPEIEWGSLNKIEKGF